MPDPRFYPQPEPVQLKKLAELTGAKLGSPADAVRIVKSVAPLDKAGADDLSFFDNRKYKDQFSASDAGACFARPDDAPLAPASMALLLHEDPYTCYAIAANTLYPRPVVSNRISEHAFIHATATIGAGCEIGPGVVIKAGAELGARCMIDANAVIGRGVKMGNDCHVGANASLSHTIMGERVNVFPGARIGQDGFGYALSAQGHTKVPQLGRVIIEDDVEIGANTTIDRGASSDTLIGRGAIIDNLVQIGHNVVVGPGCVLVAQSGVAGSTRLGRGVVMAAQSGIAGHLQIGDWVRLGAQSGVMRNVEAGEELLGSPAYPVRQFFRQRVQLERLLQEQQEKQKGKKNNE